MCEIGFHQGNRPQEVHSWPLGVTVVVSKNHIHGSSVWLALCNVRSPEGARL